MMLLVLALPPDWPEDVHLELVHLRPRPCDPRSWVRELLVGAHGGHADVTHARRLETDDGWPFDLITIRADERPLRCVALYTFRDYVAAAVLNGVSEATPVIERALRAARPDWRSDTPVALVELWRDR